jgi:hypothetical protein
MGPAIFMRQTFDFPCLETGRGTPVFFLETDSMTTVKPGERFAMVFVITGVTIVWVGVAWFAINAILHG